MNSRLEKLNKKNLELENRKKNGDNIPEKIIQALDIKEEELMMEIRQHREKWKGKKREKIKDDIEAIKDI